MIFFDTNVLVYATINQDSDKQQLADQWIDNAILDQSLMISPLVISELIFVLAKLGQLSMAKDAVEFFSRFSTPAIDKREVLLAAQIADELDCGKSINDLIHLIHAEGQGCTKLVTFDKGFKRFEGKGRIDLILL